MSTPTKTSHRKGLYTPKLVMAIKHVELQMTDHLRAAIGPAQRGGNWCIKAPSFHGKTNAEIQFIKDLALFQKVGFNSVEEGFNMAMQAALRRHNMAEVNHNMVLASEDFGTWSARLKNRQGPKVWFVDSLQCFDMDKRDFMRIRANYPNILFVFVTQVDSKGVPVTAMGRTAWSLADIKIEVKGKEAFIENRNDGQFRTYTIWEEGSDAYYANGLLKDRELQRVIKKAKK